MHRGPIAEFRFSPEWVAAHTAPIHLKRMFVFLLNALRQRKLKLVTVHSNECGLLLGYADSQLRSFMIEFRPVRSESFLLQQCDLQVTFNFNATEMPPNPTNFLFFVDQQGHLHVLQKERGTSFPSTNTQARQKIRQCLDKICA